MLLELQTIAKDCLRQIRKAKSLALSPAGPFLYEDTLRSDEGFLLSLVNCKKVEDFEELVTGVSWQRLPSRRSKAMADADEHLCDQVIEIRNGVKEVCKGLVKQYLDRKSVV